jgi:RNA polymerase sigma-70 factor (ECF subfamily)
MRDDGQERFAAAVLPHLDAAYNLTRWLVRDAHDAQDVVQDALVRALRHFAGFRGGDPESLAIWRAQRREIDAAIAALPIVFREAVVLRELEELSYRDIARITDVPIGTVMSRLSRARHLLAVALRPEATRSPS